MENLDRVAYSVLRNNYTLLATDLDARRITTDAAAMGLISQDDKKAIWHSAGCDGVSAGVEKMLDLLLRKNQEGVFQLFLEVLKKHNDMRFWADCMKDEYEAEKMKLVKSMLQNDEPRRDTTTKRPLLRKSVGQLDCETPPTVKRKRSEMSLLKEFRQAKGHDRETVLGILTQFEGDLKSVRDSENKSLLHIACEIMDFRVAKSLVEDYAFEINDRDSRGNTPLHIACQQQKVQTVIYLIKIHACNLNIKNSDGLTPLHIAARIGPMMVITHLLNAKRLDRSVEDDHGKTAVDIVRSDPNFAPCLERKVSIASLGSLSVSSSKSGGDGEARRKVSLPSTLESYGRLSERSEETTSLLNDGADSPEAEDAQLKSGKEREKSREKSPQAFPTNGVHYTDTTDGVDVVIGNLDSLEGDVVLRDKSELKLAQLESTSDAAASSSGCCCCFGRRKKYHVPKKSRSFNCGRFCLVGRVLSLLLAAILVGFLLLGALVYYLVEDSKEDSKTR